MPPLSKGIITPIDNISIKDDDGHKIEIEPKNSSGEYFQVTLSGFLSNEKLEITSKSCKESFSFSVNTFADGTFIFESHPAVIGYKEGSFEITIKTKNMKPLTLRHYWGKIAFSGPNAYKTLKNKYR